MRNPERSKPDILAAYATASIRRGSRSFSLAAALFDAETKERAHMLYSWCRFCDDQVDGQHYGHLAPGSVGPPADARQRLDYLTAQTEDALRGRPVTEPPFRALQRLAERCRIPERYPLELLAGFRMDVEGCRHRSLEDLITYCYHVAGAVGVMMAHVMGVDDEGMLDRAADLGIAFQLTNICRDAADDARAGRVYLPLDWLEAAGLSPGDVGTARAWPRLVPLVHRLLDEADRYYDSAASGLRGLAWRSAWAAAAALGIYRDIGRVIRRRGAAAWDRRAVVSSSRMALRVASALVRAAAAVSIERGRPRASRAGLWSRPVAPRPSF